MDTDTISIEKLIKNIYDDKIEIEKEKEKIKQNSNQIELLRKSLDFKKAEMDSHENEIIENAKIKARDILLNTKKNANDIISELNQLRCNESFNSLKKANEIRNKLNDNINNISLNTEKEDDNQSFSILKNPKIGMKVLVININQEGIIISNPTKSNEVQVQIGSMKINSKLSNLTQILSNQNLKNKKNINHIKLSQNILKSKTISTEINVIGQNVEEAILVIDKFLDDAYLSNLNSVRIVHGKGTGKLRDGIHAFLRKNPHVQSFRIGTFGEGEMGVTIVELK